MTRDGVATIAGNGAAPPAPVDNNAAAHRAVPKNFSIISPAGIDSRVQVLVESKVIPGKGKPLGLVRRGFRR